MSSQNNLEINGNLSQYALAELLAAIIEAQLNGSLRLENNTEPPPEKAVVYFDAGDIVFAVSNARRHRLYELLLRAEKITKEQLAAIADFTSDLKLREHLTRIDFLPKAEIDEFFGLQIREILRDAFSWRAGVWTFTPLVRVKGDIHFKIDAAALLVECARNFSDAEAKAAVSEFASSSELFAVKTSLPAHINLLPEEAFVFSRFQTGALDATKALAFSGLPEAATFKILRTLWLGGFLARRNYQTPFSERKLSAILSANMTLKKNETPAQTAANPAFAPKISEAANNAKTAASKSSAAEEEKNLPIDATTVADAPERAISLEEYLERTESSSNFYHLFDLPADASVAAVKQSYFAFAKRFHPDLFYKEVDAEKHRRIQDAFSKIAHAYETLKTESSRELYDFKMRKELAETDDAAAAAADVADSGEDSVNQLQFKRAAEDFERGFEFLLKGESEEAAAFLARAAHLAPENARYRAFFGKALSIADERQKHKAEAEMQAAVRLDPNNAEHRLMLAKFFSQMRLFKRAEGELKRLLTVFPGNAEAKKMLDELKKER